ncbi:MAG: precorrin-6A/cobalt-precorrin-6A reductase, partial [Lachnospiraceae bacterium]|nr:precorrin-6A/cobalt-precorrin-6A reductase [Lachnospiraceae bacterium]
MQNTENTDNTENIDNTQNTDNTRKQTAKILIFGGTIEGRQVSEYLCERHIMHTVCVATEYGEEVLLPEQSGKPILYSCRTVHQGRMNKTQMCNFLREEMYALVIDATHPYAVEVSENIQKACEKEQIPYVRYLRPDGCDAENTAQR